MNGDHDRADESESEENSEETRGLLENVADTGSQKSASSRGRNSGSQRNFMYQDVPVEIDDAGNRFITFQCMRYAYDFDAMEFRQPANCFGILDELPAQNEASKGISSTSNPNATPTCTGSLMHAQLAIGGHSEAGAERKLKSAGPNLILVHVGSFWDFLCKEFLGAMYIVQFFAVLTLIVPNYWHVGIFLLAQSTVVGVVQAYMTRKSQKEIQTLASIREKVNVVRDKGEMEAGGKKKASREILNLRYEYP